MKRRLPTPIWMLWAQIREVGRLLTIRPAAPRGLLLRVGQWAAAVAIREFAWHLFVLGAVAVAVAALAGIGGSAVGLIAIVVVVLLTLNQLRLAYQSHRSAAAVERALDDLDADAGPRMPTSHLALPALMLVDSQVRHERGVVYHDGDRYRLRLDIYRPADGTDPEGPPPAVIQVHGGGWLSGSRLEQGIPLLNHLAGSGWVGFNIDYRLSPEATFPDHVIDVKRAIRWVRSNAAELGVDPDRICLTGGSAGGHLTALAALTAGDPAFQPGFEEADTSVSAAVPFHGVYDLTDADGVYWPEMAEWLFAEVVFKRTLAEDPEAYRQASPRWRVHRDAPPFLVIHGERDTLVPVEDARGFAEALRAVSRNPVRYVELPHAEHAFDILPSLRTARIVEGIERFLRVSVPGGPTPADPDREPAGC